MLRSSPLQRSRFKVVLIQSCNKNNNCVCSNFVSKQTCKQCLCIIFWIPNNSERVLAWCWPRDYLIRIHEGLFSFFFFVTHLSALGRMYHCSVKKWILLGEVTAFVEILWCCGEISTWCVFQLSPSLKIVPGTPCLRGGTRINAMIITKDWHQGDLAKRLIKLRYSEFLRRGSLGKSILI